MAKSKSKKRSRPSNRSIKIPIKKSKKPGSPHEAPLLDLKNGSATPSNLIRDIKKEEYFLANPQPKGEKSSPPPPSSKDKKNSPKKSLKKTKSVSKTDKSKPKKPKQKLINRLQKRLKLYRQKPPLKLLIIAASLLGLLLLAYLGWLIYQRFASEAPNGDKVAFSIDAPRELVAGDEVVLNIDLDNQYDTFLEDVVVTVEYPEGFSFIESDPTPTHLNNNQWSYSELLTGESQKITLKGQLLGLAGSTKTIRANLSFRVHGFEEKITRNQTVDLTILETPISFETNFPPAVASDRQFSMNLSITNNHFNHLSNLQLRATFPSSFQFSEADPYPSENTNIWQIDHLDSDETLDILIKGSVSGETNEKKLFLFELGSTVNDQFIPYKETEESIKIVSSILELTQTVNSQTDLEVDLGAALNYQIHYRNSGQVNLEDLSLITELNSPLLDRDSFVIDGGRLEDTRIIWDRTTKEELGNVEPQKEGDLNFSVKIIGSLTPEMRADLQNLKIFSQTTYSAQEPEKSERLNGFGNKTSVKINSTVKFSASAQYFDADGNPLGQGPLPPVVGETTTYRINLHLANNALDIEEGKVTLTLPANVSFAANAATSVGTLTNEINRVIWTIGRVAANSDPGWPNLEASFDVSIIPAETDLNRSVTLISSSVFEGKNSRNEEEVIVKRDGLTTDIAGANQGKVQAVDMLNPNNSNP